jgi:lysozyme inhibitor LprI
VFIVDAKKLQARNIAEPMRKAFVQVLRREGGNLFKKRADDYKFTFSAPWFVGRDRFYVSASAAIPKATQGEFTYDLTFDYNFGSNQITLEKSSVSDADATEPSDRELNRAYRSLIGLLPPAEREALVQEERTWIAERDATKGSQAKEKLVRDRIEELTKRRDDRVEQLNAAQKQ